MKNYSHLILILCVAVIVAGVGAHVVGRFQGYGGKLPRDIHLRSENGKIFFPFSTTVIVSSVLAVLFYLLYKFFR